MGVGCTIRASWGIHRHLGWDSSTRSPVGSMELSLGQTRVKFRITQVLASEKAGGWEGRPSNWVPDTFQVFTTHLLCINSFHLHRWHMKEGGFPLQMEKVNSMELLGQQSLAHQQPACLASIHLILQLLYSLHCASSTGGTYLTLKQTVLPWIFMVSFHETLTN